MRVHRGALFWGVFFVLLGAIPLADREGWIDVGQWADLGRLWPLAIVAVGLAILLSRTQLAIFGTLVAGLILGGLVGSAIAAGGAFITNFGPCNPANLDDLQHVTRNGTLGGGAAVELHFNCGSVDLTTGGGDTWNIDAGYRSSAPTVDASSSRLAVRSGSNSREQKWVLVVPREQVDSLDVELNAGSGRFDVSGTTLTGLRLHANAGDLRIAAAEGTVNGLDVEVNAGHAGIDLGGSADGRVNANAGAIDVCAPPTADLRFVVQEQLTFATNLRSRGLTQNGNVWTRAGSGGPTIRLDVSGNAGSFNLDPTGGCK